MTDTIPADQTTTAISPVGSSRTGTIDTTDDVDAWKVTLKAGEKYTFFLDGTGGSSTLSNPLLQLYDSNGNLLAADDDTGGGSNSRISFTASADGTYYLAASGASGSTGNYVLTSVGQNTNADMDVIARAMTDWSVLASGTGVAPKFDHKNLTVNISGLTAAGQSMARAALSAWSDVAGISFTETTGSADITFNDDLAGDVTSNKGGTTYTYSGASTIATATVSLNSHLLDSGTSAFSDAFQIYVHEIGHALGLYHTGAYTQHADYGADNWFKNDTGMYSIMSYFDQEFNGGTGSYLSTAQMADILAIQKLYGAASTTRSGDTTYGFHTNAGARFDPASIVTTAGFTVYDNGGTDTFDFSGFSATQSLDLRPGSFSSVGGASKNVAIALGVQIENAIGGTGADSIIGNGGANTLDGRGGNDVIDGNDGNDTLIGGGGNDTLRGGNGDDVVVYDANDSTEDGGAGVDTLNVGFAVTVNLGNADQVTGGGTTRNFENVNGASSSAALSLTGSSVANTLIGGAAADTMSAGAGADVLDGRGGNDVLAGGAGNDIYMMGRGYGADKVFENDATSGNRDILRFASGIAQNQLWFKRIGNNLEVDIIGTKDSMTIDSWYSSSARHVELFQANSYVLADSNVQKLVQAMAALTPPAFGQTSLNSTQHKALDTLLTTNWKHS